VTESFASDQIQHAVTELLWRRGTHEMGRRHAERRGNLDAAAGHSRSIAALDDLLGAATGFVNEHGDRARSVILSLLSYAREQLKVDRGDDLKDVDVAHLAFMLLRQIVDGVQSRNTYSELLAWSTTPSITSAPVLPSEHQGQCPTQDAASAYEEPRKGRFKNSLVFLHEVGWILTKIASTSEFPSLETVHRWFDRHSSEMAPASDRALKGAVRKWFRGSWPTARGAATEHYKRCTPGPSCDPPEVQK
jgi:hypothetical protein